MAHPHAAHRQTKVEHSRVAHITKGYAAGGAVHGDEAADKALIKKEVKHTALKVDGKDAKVRSDRSSRGKKRADGGRSPGTSDSSTGRSGGQSFAPGKLDDDWREMRNNGIAPLKRARGGRAPKGKHAKTVVNVIAGGGHPPMMPPPMAAAPGGPMPAPMPPRPPMPMPPPAMGGGAPGMPPGMPPPGMPPRQADGRAYAKGGAVKSGPAWKEGLRSGTQVQHTDGKNDGKDIGRPKPITYKTGGKVESPQGVAAATRLPGGAGGGEARLVKEGRARKDYARA